MAAQLAEAIVRATEAMQNPACPPDQRAQAVAFFEQVKAGDPRAALAAAAGLTGAGQALEVRVAAFSLLHFLVQNRWKAFAAEEQKQILEMAFQQFRDVDKHGAGAALLYVGEEGGV